MASELIIVPTAFRQRHHEDQIRHALANVVDVFENEGDIPLTIITGLADTNTEELIVEVGFEVSDVGNIVVYLAMESSSEVPLTPITPHPETGRIRCHDRQATSSDTPRRTPISSSPTR